MVIQGLEVGEVCGYGLKGQLGQIERAFLRRREEIARIYHSGGDVVIFPDVLWKEVGAAIDALRRFSELRWQERETSLVFLRMIANNLDQVEPEPVCVPFDLAWVSLGFAMDSLADGHLEAAARQLELVLSHLEEVKDLLRPQKEKVRIATLRQQHDSFVAMHSPGRQQRQGGD